MGKKIIKAALVGNPNCGKTSLFNILTGLRQKVGNFAGVTVDKKTGLTQLTKDLQAEVIDLPGTYSLYPKRIDEYVTYDVLLNQQNDSYPDVIVIVADASNLKRNLLFCSQIIDLKIPVIIALNMLDVAKKNNISIDIPGLQKELGVKIVGINARDSKGIDDLKKAMQETLPVPTEDFIDIHAIAPIITEEVQKISDAKSYYTAFQIANHYINIYCLDASQKRKIKTVIESNEFPAARLQGEKYYSGTSALTR